MPFNPQKKFSGDLIRADDWNTAMDELKRIETDKVNLSGGEQISGALSLIGPLGVGTTNPNREVTVQDAGNCYLNVRANGGSQEVLIGADSDGAIVSAITNHDLVLRAGSNSEKVRIKTDGKVGVGLKNPKYLLELAGGAYCDGKSWSNGSSREYKSDVETLRLDAARATVAALNPVTFRYREGDGHDRVGFIAEEVPELVAQADRKGLSPMDILAVVTRVVQDQQREIEGLRAQLAALAGAGAA